MAIYSDINYITPKKSILVEDIKSIYQSIFTILGTDKNERVFRPEFGFKLDRYLFEPCDQYTADLILDDMFRIPKYEPRVEITSDSEVTPVPEQHLFIIKLVFYILGFTNVQQTLNLTLRQ